MSIVLPNSHVLTNAGFKKLPLIAENEHKQKIRLYHLDPSLSEKVEAAKVALENKQREGWEYKNTCESFREDIQHSPYLLKEGRTLRLLSSKEAIELQLKYGVIGSKAEKGSHDIIQLLKEHHIETDKQLVTFYNEASPSIQEDLLTLINTLFFIFSKERTILKVEEVKTITMLGQCHHAGIQTGALNLLIDLFEGSGFRNKDYGFGLKYLLDQMPKEFFKNNQLLLLDIFDKLSNRLSSLLHTNESVNHEIDPLMASLVAVARATFHSGFEGLNQATQDKFYEKLKNFYNNEIYFKRIEALSKKTNYFLVHQSLWTIQHLVRISSSENPAVEALKRVAHGLYSLKTVAGAPLKAATKILQGELPDESFVDELKKAYKHAKEAFDINDLPKPWYDVLENTETILLNPHVTESDLDKIVELIEKYEKVYTSFNTLIKNQFNQVAEESKELAFGLVGQVSALTLDHQQVAIRLKALEILKTIFNRKKQSSDVRLLILTTVQNIIAKKDPTTDVQAKTLQQELYQRDSKLKGLQIFRQMPYPCLPLLPESSLLLGAAVQKLQAISQGTQPLPMSKFIYGSKDIKIFEETVTVGGNFAPKSPEPISSEELKRVIEGAERIHILVLDRNEKANTTTRIGNTKEMTFKAKVEIKGNFEG